MTDPLQYVKQWDFKELKPAVSAPSTVGIAELEKAAPTSLTPSVGQSNPLKERPFRFNAYARPHKVFSTATPLYSDQPDIELKLFAYAPRHKKQQALASTPNLSASQLGNWWEVAAAIYDIVLQSRPTGDLQETFVQPLLPQTLTQASQQDQPILGITPDQPLTQDHKSSQLIQREVATRRLCLFNVVVACEWWPISLSYRRQLLWAFRRMSDFLCDVTDGYMALGSVAIGGYEWMNYADIQILASNRLHPRSWVSAMQFPEKFTPIRVGRGLWNKRNRRIMPWNEPEGYRTLVHEWAHYALGLKDRYLEPVVVELKNKQLVESKATKPLTTLAVPTISLPLETIMAVLEGTSELVDSTNGPGKAEEWDSLGRRFRFLNILEGHQSNEGPGNLPLPLPEIQFVDPVAGAANEANQALDPQAAREADLPFKPPIYIDYKALANLNDDPNSYPAVIDSHCWVFTIRGNLTQPEDLVAYGTLDARAGRDGFALPGARKGDTVVLIGDGYILPSDLRHPIVLTSKLVLNEEESFFLPEGGWQSITPSRFPLTDVYPQAHSRPYPPYQIEVEIDDSGWSGWVFPLGNRSPGTALHWPSAAHRTEPRSVTGQRGMLSAQMVEHDDTYDRPTEPERAGLPSLDGHILLTKHANDPDKMQLTIAAYSIGGGPKSANPPYTNPIPSGSSEGNALLFFYDESASTPNDDDSGDVTMAVTTRNYGIPFEEMGFEPRSYTYSFAPNRPLVEDIHPTLVMFVDRDKVREAGGIELRRHGSSDPANLWKQAIPVLRKQDLSLIAAPLTKADRPANPAGAELACTAPRLFVDPPAAERYRLVDKDTATRAADTSRDVETN